MILSSLAEFIEQFLKDQYWSCRAENDEGLTTKQTEDSTSQGRAQKTLHHTLNINNKHTNFKEK